MQITLLLLVASLLLLLLLDFSDIKQVAAKFKSLPERPTDGLRLFVLATRRGDLCGG